MKIEAGKRYKMRSGEISGVLESSGRTKNSLIDPVDQWLYTAGTSKQGSRVLCSEKHPNDLMEVYNG